MKATLNDRDYMYIRRRITWKLSQEMEPFYESKMEEYMAKYLSDDKLDQYVVRTRGKITSSKFKCYLQNPEEFYVRYVLELPPLEEDEKRYFVIGKAVEHLLYYGIEKRSERYYIDKGYVKADLATLIAARDWLDAKTVEKAHTLDQLREMYYQGDDKIRLTPGEWKQILGTYYEAQKQKIFDLYGKYEPQVYMECKYRELIITGTLDRYNQEDWIIRDWKTTGQIDNAYRDIEETFDYITQMAFYFTIAYINHRKECDVYLDLLGTKAPYASLSYKMSRDRLKHKMLNEIRPALDALQTSFDDDVWPVASRDKAMKSPYYPILESSIMLYAQE